MLHLNVRLFSRLLIKSARLALLVGGDDARSLWHKAEGPGLLAFRFGLGSISVR